MPIQLPSGDYTVRLVRLGTAGATRVDFLDLVEAAATDVAGTGAPRLALEPPRPNPASRAVEIAYSLASPADLTLAAYDVSGRLVHTLVSGPTPAGGHRLRWDLSDARGQRVRPGVYFLRLEVPGRQLLRRMAVVR